MEALAEYVLFEIPWITIIGVLAALPLVILVYCAVFKALSGFLKS